MRIRGSLTQADVESLLEDAVIPLRIACQTPADNLWMLSLWFRYRDGHLRCATSADADVVSYLEHDDRVAFEVSTNDPPYRGVRGHGTARLEPDPEKALLRELAERYLGSVETPLARRLLHEDREEVTIDIEPEVVYGWDFTERMADSVESR